MLTKSVHGQHVLLFHFIATQGAATDSLAKNSNNGLKFTQLVVKGGTAATPTVLEGGELTVCWKEQESSSPATGGGHTLRELSQR